MYTPPRFEVIKISRYGKLTKIFREHNIYIECKQIYIARQLKDNKTFIDNTFKIDHGASIIYNTSILF